MATSDTTGLERPPAVPRFARAALRGLCLASLAATLVVLGGTAFVLYRETQWLPDPVYSEDLGKRNSEAFFHGTIGTEVAPLPVMQVLPAMFPEHFQPLGKDAGTWDRQFGFIPSERLPVPHPRGESLENLPLGFTLSNYRPRSGAPSPVKFVGLACATCHTTFIRRPDGSDFLAVGTGNTALNLFAWLDAFQAALLDRDRFTAEKIFAAYEQTANPPLSLEERLMIRLWLSGAQAKLAADVEKYDQPYGEGKSLNPDIVPTGPCRTQPFRTLVRTALHRPGAGMHVYTKIAAVYWQDLEGGWGQFDGGIKGLDRRSSGAAFAAGATVQNMNLAEIADNIRWASAYLKELKGPHWEQVFPLGPAIDEDRAEQGKQVYLDHCDRCHGHPEGDRKHPATLRWVRGKDQETLTPLDRIGTDPERVTFRYYDELPDTLAGLFPEGHQFDFPRDALRPLPGDPTRGYFNKPLHSAFSRAPYLHNASVLTLKELIHLAERRPVFLRGENRYDVEAVGLSSPDARDPGAAVPRLYFRFDTRVAGNSNRGHDYPWPRAEVEKDAKKRADLEHLLEYLKTL
jgi:mono/diheme cytochrome c family protein